MIDIYADGADIDEILKLNEYDVIKGFTTNPSLFAKAGVKNYKKFAKDLVGQIPDKCISFEVITDDFVEMYAQAMEIASWGNNVYVKIPCVNTRGNYTTKVISDLAKQGVKINVTAILTLSQVCEVSRSLANHTPSIISVFAGRIADTSNDPKPVMATASCIITPYVQQKLLWASTREVINLFDAEKCNCHIITMPKNMIDKYLTLRYKSLTDYSIETVKMFYNDAINSGYTI